ncbi:MAG: hypothetical protein ACPLN0_07105 [Candidatus Hydrothermia bacterium]
MHYLINILVNTYLSLIPHSAIMRSFCITSLYNTSDAVFYAPSLIGEKLDITANITSYSFAKEFHDYAFSIKYERVGAGIHFKGTKNINEKSLYVASSRELNTISMGLGFTIQDRFYYELSSKSFGILASVSNKTSELLYGATTLLDLSGQTFTTSLFASFNSSFGVTHLNLTITDGIKSFSIAQDLSIFPLINLSFGSTNYPSCYFVGLFLKNYIKPLINFRYLPDLGFVTTSGIEYTF